MGWPVSAARFRIPAGRGRDTRCKCSAAQQGGRERTDARRMSACVPACLPCCLCGEAMCAPDLGRGQKRGHVKPGTVSHARSMVTWNREAPSDRSSSISCVCVARGSRPGLGRLAGCVHAVGVCRSRGAQFDDLSVRLPPACPSALCAAAAAFVVALAAESPPSRVPVPAPAEAEPRDELGSY